MLSSPAWVKQDSMCFFYASTTLVNLLCGFPAFLQPGRSTRTYMMLYDAKNQVVGVLWAELLLSHNVWSTFHTGLYTTILLSN